MTPMVKYERTATALQNFFDEWKQWDHSSAYGITAISDYSVMHMITKFLQQP